LISKAEMRLRVYQSNSKRITPIDYCSLDDRQADDIILTVRKLADDFKLKPMIQKQNSFLRHF
jgi:tRNA/tmRNA/rRNA uracil-C5-methylase (TrmA/RlmC/RlmD family)